MNTLFSKSGRHREPYILLYCFTLFILAFKDVKGFITQATYGVQSIYVNKQANESGSTWYEYDLSVQMIYGFNMLKRLTNIPIIMQFACDLWYVASHLTDL